MSRIILLRHGATALNRLVPYRIQGRRTDPPLDELGRRQASAAAEALAAARIVPAAVYASPLRRSVQTADAVARGNSRGVVVVDELTEADVGRWEGRTWAEIEADDPDEFARFMAHPGTVPYPEGESFQDVRRRVCPALERLAEAHRGETIAVVGHNVVNRAVLAHYLGVPIDQARGLRQANGCINIIEVVNGIPRVATFNAALHLEGIDAPASVRPGVRGEGPAPG